MGGFVRKRLRTLDEEAPTDLATVVTATLTLLGLIIAFSFSMTVSRYEQGKNYEAEEANAIGTEYVRVALLPATHTERVRDLLRHLHHRVLFYETRNQHQLEHIDKDTAALEVELWAGAVRRCGATHPCRSPRDRRNERRFKNQGDTLRLRGGNASRPRRGVCGRHRDVLQLLDRLRRASEGDHPLPGVATGSWCCHWLCLSRSFSYPTLTARVEV
jgi:hypothetical protein